MPAKPLKRLLKLLALLLATILLLLVVAWCLLRSTPRHYRPYAWDPEQRSNINQQAVDKLLRAQNLAASAQAAEKRAQLAPAQSPPVFPPLTISFSEEEINAFLLHNAELEGVKDRYERYVTEPGVFLRNARIILSARLNGFSCIASFHFQPLLDDRGQLHLRLVKTTAGLLPVPRVVLERHLNHLRSTLIPRLPQWQREAQIDSTGRANSSAAAAAMTLILISALDGTAADPVVFIPLSQGDKSSPLRVANLTVGQQSLAITLQPMSPEQRQALLNSIRGRSSTPRLPDHPQ